MYYGVGWFDGGGEMICCGGWGLKWWVCGCNWFCVWIGVKL